MRIHLKISGYLEIRLHEERINQIKVSLFQLYLKQRRRKKISQKRQKERDEMEIQKEVERFREEERLSQINSYRYSTNLQSPMNSYNDFIMIMDRNDKLP